MSKILWGHKQGEPSYFEDVITENECHFDAAKKWAKKNGYDSFRVSDIDGKPDFIGTINK